MHYSLHSKPVYYLLISQFISALADNAIFIAAIALLKAHGHLGWIAFLQMCFLIAYVLLAPYVGPYADGHAKNRVMFVTNVLKLVGCISMLFISPIISYSIIGIGAASYSPAKYGILPELLSSDKLIRANGLIESTTVIAIIAGVVMGGFVADHSAMALISACGIIYMASALMALLIPKTPAKKHFKWSKLWLYTWHYFKDVRLLLTEKSCRFAVVGTSTFWSVGATLRLILFAWIPIVFLTISNEVPSNLMGILSIGVAMGALTVGFWIKLDTVKRVIWPGLALGPAIGLTVLSPTIFHLSCLMFIIGLMGGMFIIPLNALIQDRGNNIIGTGHTLAVQNFIENMAMLLLISAYSLAQKYGISLHSIILLLALSTFLSISSTAFLKFR